MKMLKGYFFKFTLSVLAAFGVNQITFGQIVNYNSQYYLDALNYSYTNIAGTSRILGLGGAGSTLGGDITSAFFNPAGLGLYRKSEASITGALNFASTSTQYLNNTTLDNRSNLFFPSFGIVFANVKDDLIEDPYRGGAFAITFTRTNSFQNQYSFSGRNLTNSMTDFFAEAATALQYDSASLGSPSNIEDVIQLAYHGYLFQGTLGSGYTSQFEGTYQDGTTYNGFPVEQEGTVLSRGGQYQWNFSYGGNIMDKIYLGASVGVPLIRHIIEKTYKETPQNNNPLRDFTWEDYLKISGRGINVQVGTIIKPVDFFRFGISVQSPTYFSMTNEEEHSINTNFTFGAPENLSTIRRSFNYNLVTPARIKGGISVIIGKRGFITADGEYVVYSSARLSGKSFGDNYNFSGDNRAIKNAFQNTFNLNLGAEFREDIYRIRGGIGYYGDPLASNSVRSNNTSNNPRIFGSIGGGIRLSDYYFDAALIHSFAYNSTFKQYPLFGEEPTASVKNRNTSLTFTFGTFF